MYSSSDSVKCEDISLIYCECISQYFVLYSAICGIFISEMIVVSRLIQFLYLFIFINYPNCLGDLYIVEI